MDGPPTVLSTFSQHHCPKFPLLRLKAFLLNLANAGQSHLDYLSWSDYRPRALSPGCTMPALCVEHVLHAAESADRLFQSALNSRLGWAEKGRFLEQFRYTIIASQLLNDVPNPGIYKRQDSLQSAGNGLLGPDQDGQKLAFSWIGISVTASAAFAWVWSIHWTRKVATSTSRMWPLLLVPTVAIMICSVLYLYCRRQWLHWVRSQAVESASTLVAGAQNLDAAVSASINLIQEVELISHGYRMQEEPVPPFFPALLTGSRSSPLPPVTRIEEKSQLRRCTRLRSALQRALSSLPAAYYRAFEEMKALAVQADLEKYYNIYEISRTEMLEMEGVKDTFMSDFGQETLKSFKYGSQKLHLARKLFFCSLLALSADGGKVDFARWSTATRLMDSLSVETSRATQDVDETLGAEEGKGNASGNFQSLDDLICSYRTSNAS